MLPTGWTLALVSVGTGLVFGGLAYGLRALTGSGALAGGGLATCLVGLGGWTWVVPGLTFFVLSSVLSRVGTRRKAAVAHRVQKGSVRDAAQVLANGGVAWGLLLVWAVVPQGANGMQATLYAGGCGAFAAAAADTWATELGTLSPETPRSIVTGRAVPTGTSGAVSGIGTLGGVLGAGTVAGSALLGVVSSEVILFAVVTASGTLGMLCDSLAGATLQARYRDPATGALTERRPGDRAAPVDGWRGIDNDVVNGIGTTAGAMAAMGLYGLFG